MRPSQEAHLAFSVFGAIWRWHASWVAVVFSSEICAGILQHHTMQYVPPKRSKRLLLHHSCLLSGTRPSRYAHPCTRQVASTSPSPECYGMADLPDAASVWGPFRRFNQPIAGVVSTGVPATIMVPVSIQPVHCRSGVATLPAAAIVLGIDSTNPSPVLCGRLPCNNYRRGHSNFNRPVDGVV